MKIDAERGVNFPPVTVTITLEGQDEYDAFYNLFNYVPICRYLESMGLDHEKVRDALRNTGAGYSVAGVGSLFKKLEEYINGNSD
jgi:hypothetical protein